MFSQNRTETIHRCTIINNTTMDVFVCQLFSYHRAFAPTVLSPRNVLSPYLSLVKI